MDGTPGLIAGLAATAGSVVTSWIQRGAAVGVKEVKEALDKIVGADGKAGPDTLLGKLAARVAAIEALAPSLATLAGLPGQVQRLESYVAEQLRLAQGRIEEVERAQRDHRRAERTRTGSMPAFADEEARREIAEAVRRLDALEQRREEERGGIVDLQLQLKRLDTILDLLVGGSLAPGGAKHR